jgi:enoyl-CoA hydratase
MSAAEVLIAVDGAVGRLTLNRPQALGALTTNMCRLMIDALLAWRADGAIEAVLIDHAGERGFCAGGDIRALADSVAGDGMAAREFFFTEYRLDHLIFGYPKPVITVMDGVTMGGGVGISWSARYRIATERTTFAMPETGIGLFPDVGGGWFLPRLHGSTGAWLCLTGARIKAAGCEILGIATDVVPAARLPEFKSRLIADPGSVETILVELESDPGRSAMIERHDDIDRHRGGFGGRRIGLGERPTGEPAPKIPLEPEDRPSPASPRRADDKLRAGADHGDAHRRPSGRRPRFRRGRPRRNRRQGQCPALGAVHPGRRHRRHARRRLRPPARRPGMVVPA